jgi:hypothetical protein
MADEHTVEPTQKQEESIKTAAETPSVTTSPQSGGQKTTPTKRGGKIQAFLSSKRGKIVAAAILVVIAVTTLMIIPTTRYGIAGLALKKTVTFTVIDATTNKAISQAEVILAGKTVKSDPQGKVQFQSIPVGEYQVHITKNYYKDATQTVLVPILTNPQDIQTSLAATGRQVPVAVMNKITGKPLEKAIITVSDTSSATNDQGESTIVLPANKQTITGKVSLNGYNDQQITITVTEQKDAKNTFTLTPSGKLYFLSKRTGNISVLKSDLDGSNVKTVLEGTGKEDETGTVLLASRDWKYLALLARRDSQFAKVYLIDTASDTLSVIDEGDADFAATGWYNHTFIYTVSRHNLQDYQPKQNALKSFNAESKKIATLDETNALGDQATGAAFEQYGSIRILNNVVVFSKEWYGVESHMNGQHITVTSVQPDGANKKVVKQFDKLGSTGASYISLLKLYKPQELYFKLQIGFNGDQSFWEYENGAVTEAKDITDSTFNKDYPTFLISPSDKKTFWFESRDGRNVLFEGDANSSQAKDLGDLADYTPYGWYSDDYLLLSKKGSELYIAPADDTLTAQQILKITDYHKPAVSITSYGYGYGGL